MSVGGPFLWRGTAVSRIGAFTKIESMTRIVKGARSGICPFCEILTRTSMGSGGRSPRLRRFRQCPLNSKLLYELSFQCLTRTSVSAHLRRNDSFNEVIRSTRYGAFIQVSFSSVQRMPDAQTGLCSSPASGRWRMILTMRRDGRR